jgi:hypothetical protein
MSARPHPVRLCGRRRCPSGGDRTAQSDRILANTRETPVRRAEGLARVVARISLGIGILSTLVACAASTPLSRQAHESIRSVSINREVVMPKGMTYIGQSQAVSGTLLGPFGAAIAAAAAQGPAAQLLVAMKEGASTCERSCASNSPRT